MSDNWSLKDIDRSMNFKFYEPDDIETLRLKLIEDIERIPMWKLMSGALENIKNLINKRFGVDE